MTRRCKKFQVETLSMEGGVEAVDGLLVGFDVLMATGQMIQLQGLRHDGIGRSNTTLRAKVLTVPQHFAEKWGLEEAQLTKPDAVNPNNHLYTRTSRPLQLVIGMDLVHLAPALVDSYQDEHGFVQLSLLNRPVNS